MPNNSLEPSALRFAKHPEGRGSSTDPGQPSVWLWRDTVLGWPGGSSRGRWAAHARHRIGGSLHPPP